MRVCVVGLGYIGLPTAAMLASRGHEVLGCDTNPRVVEGLRSGQSHFREPDLDMLLSAAVSTGRLTAGPTPAEADAFILAVPTPFRDGHAPDLTYVEAATDSIAPHLRPGCTVILESTSPVGTTEALARRLAAARPDLRLPTYKSDSAEADIAVAHCPERILPGRILRELVANDRIIGGVTEACAHRALTLYESFVAGATVLTDCRTAEFVKLAENAFRDVNIAFANELSVLCAAFDIDVWGAIALANRHPRVNILRPGAGVGGHCIAVDPWFLVHGAPGAARLIRTAREVNDAKPHWVTQRVADLARRFRAPVIACYGLTYKPDVDDLRESPSLDIIAALAREDGATILACDPWVKDLPPALASLPNLRLVDAETALREADIIAFLVAHRAFQRLDRGRLLTKMVVDAVGLTETRPG